MLPRGRPTLVVLSPAPSSFASSRSLLCLVLRRRRRLPRCLAALPCSRDFSHLFGVLRETPTQSPWTLQHISGPPVCKTKTKSLSQFVELSSRTTLLTPTPIMIHVPPVHTCTCHCSDPLSFRTLVPPRTVRCWRWRGPWGSFGYSIRIHRDS